MTEQEIKTLKLYATLTDTLDKYVILKEDEQGRYIEYAFVEGAPHDNRCLSWYVKPHPNYFAKRPEKVQGRLADVGEVYELKEFACGCQDKEGDERCTAGHPQTGCDFMRAMKDGWSYDEPRKCACWNLKSVKMEQIKNSIVMQTFQKTLDKAVKYLAPIAYTHKHLINLDNFIKYMEK